MELPAPGPAVPVVALPSAGKPHRADLPGTGGACCRYGVSSSLLVLHIRRQLCAARLLCSLYSILGASLEQVENVSATCLGIPVLYDVAAPDIEAPQNWWRVNRNWRDLCWRAVRRNPDVNLLPIHVLSRVVERCPWH